MTSAVSLQVIDRKLLLPWARPLPHRVVSAVFIDSAATPSTTSPQPCHYQRTGSPPTKTAIKRRVGRRNVVFIKAQNRLHSSCRLSSLLAQLSLLVVSLRGTFNIELGHRRLSTVRTKATPEVLYKTLHSGTDRTMQQPDSVGFCGDITITIFIIST